MMLTIQAFALPAAPAPAAAPSAAEVESQPQGQKLEEPHSGAAKDKRAIYYYTTSSLLPSYTAIYPYSFVPSFYPAVPPTLIL